MRLQHGICYFLEAFCNHGVITRRKGYDSIGFVRVLTLRIFMVRQMQSVNNFRDVSSHHVEWERQGQVHYDSFHGRYLSHIVVSQNVALHCFS